MISIITVARNAAETIADCLASVAGQSVRPEHVIVDGASTDGTLEIVRGWTRPGVCEGGGQRAEDRGQGTEDSRQRTENREQRTGNGGDFVGNFVGNFVGTWNVQRPTSNVERPRRRGSRGIGGRAKGRRDRFIGVGCRRIRRFFVRRSVYARYGGFRLDMGSAADYELMLRVMVKHGIRTVYIPRVLVRMGVGGVSNVSVKNRVRANRMDREAWRVNELRPYPWTLVCKPLRKVMQWWVGEPVDRWTGMPVCR